MQSQINHQAPDLVTAEVMSNLITPETLNLGIYYHYKSPQNIKYQFLVEIDARPLAALIEAANNGHRVYELMWINRPGDLLHYLWLTMIDVGEPVINHVKNGLSSLDRYRFDMPDTINELPFLDFDARFYWDADDTKQFVSNWLHHREGSYWASKLNGMLEIVAHFQKHVRQSNDYLIKHEISLIDRRQHKCDFNASVTRSCIMKNSIDFENRLPPNLAERIKSMIQQDSVKSVSSYYGGYYLWRLLVEEQVRRSAISNSSPQEAFELNGPDDGLGDSRYLDWGGYVHIPYEGMCPADVVFFPSWRTFYPEHAGADGSLAQATGFNCQHLLVPEELDFGELGCANREIVDGWIIYSQKHNEIQ